MSIHVLKKIQCLKKVREMMKVIHGYHLFTIAEKTFLWANDKLACRSHFSLGPVHKSCFCRPNLIVELSSTKVRQRRDVWIKVLALIWQSKVRGQALLHDWCYTTLARQWFQRRACKCVELTSSLWKGSLFGEKNSKKRERKGAN